MNNDNELIVVENVVKKFKSGSAFVEAVNGVSFSLQRGKFVAIKGASGSGKTTLLYLLGALEKPSSGSIYVDNVNVSALSGREENNYRLKKVGFIFQNYYLIPTLNALENVVLPMELSGSRSASKKASETLEKVGIDVKKQKRFPARLSGGEQQRVAIARALANDPAIILADEPTGNLDSKNGKMIINILKALSQEEKTVIVATHDEKIASLADVIFEMKDGKIIKTIK